MRNKLRLISRARGRDRCEINIVARAFTHVYFQCTLAMRLYPFFFFLFISDHKYVDK